MLEFIGFAIIAISIANSQKHVLPVAYPTSIVAARNCKQKCNYKLIRRQYSQPATLKASIVLSSTLFHDSAIGELYMFKRAVIH